MKVLKKLCLLVLVLAIVVPSVIVSARESSDKKMVTVYGSNGKSYKPGSSVPLSALKDAKFKITGAKKGYAYNYAIHVSGSPYKIADDPAPDWAYEGVTVDKSDKKLVKKIKKVQPYFDKIYKNSEKIKIDTFIYDSVKEWEGTVWITFSIQPIDKNGEKIETYYENSFKVSR